MKYHDHAVIKPTLEFRDLLILFSYLNLLLSLSDVSVKVTVNWFQQLIKT